MTLLSESQHSPAKVFVLGEQNVGKSSLLRRYCDGVFDDDEVNPTTQPAITFQELTLSNGNRMTLQLWDTVGQKKFRIPPEHCSGVQGVLLCFDLSSTTSFQAIPRWLKSLSIHLSFGTPVVLVGTKRDLKARREVAEDEIGSLSRQLGIKYVETSAKLDLGVDIAFGLLAEMIRRRRLEKRYSGQLRGPNIRNILKENKSPSPSLTSSASASSYLTKEPQTSLLLLLNGRLSLSASVSPYKTKDKGKMLKKDSSRSQSCSIM